MNQKTVTGHLLAFTVEAIWSVTYVATDMLLSAGFTAMHILILRFTLALAVLYLIKPKLCFAKSLKEELVFVVLSFFGMSLYYLFENFAIGKTDGTNVSILISFAPILTTVGAALVLKREKITRMTLIGFVIAIMGVIMVVFNGTVKLDFDIAGYGLAIAAATCWAVYSMLLEDVLKKHEGIIVTRRMLIYTLIWLIPVTLATNGVPNFTLLTRPSLAACLALLGIFGGSLCYLWWNMAIQRIGVVVTTNYIYLSPFITMIFAYFVTNTTITPMGAIGAVLVIGGVILSDLSHRPAKSAVS